MARYRVYFNRDIAELGPTFANCSETPLYCTNSKQDIPNGCPRCEFQIQWKAMKKEAQAEIDRGTKAVDYEFDWPIDYLLETYDTVAHADAAYPKRYSRKWTVVTSVLVSIYRGELSKLRAVEQWQMSQRLKAMRESRSDYGPEVLDD